MTKQEKINGLGEIAIYLSNDKKEYERFATMILAGELKDDGMMTHFINKRLPKLKSHLDFLMKLVREI